jgi:predicted nuclease of predicted toxin-antitoxin system
VRFLLDQNQSPSLAGLLIAAGHPTAHVRDLGLSSATDAAIMEVARERGEVIVSVDTDFGKLLSQTNASGPSIVLVRRQQGRRATHVAELLLLNLGAVAGDLEDGGSRGARQRSYSSEAPALPA